MPITRADLNIILSCVSQMLREQHIPIAEHGVAVAGSWAPADDAALQVQAGTVQITQGKTASIIGDDGDTGFAKPQLSVATTALGEQYGPVGNERAVLVHTEADGPIVFFIHGADDTPQCPAGERWIVHYNPAGASADPPTYTVVSYRKFTNDGKTAGDNAGGYRVLVGGYGTFETTGGHLITLDDTGKQITLTTAGGQKIVMDDNTSTVLIQGATVTTSDEIMRQSDGQALANEIMTAVQTWAENYITSTATGSGWSGPAPTAPTATGSTKTYTA